MLQHPAEAALDLPTPAEMREIERAAIAAGAVTGARADGARRARGRWPRCSPSARSPPRRPTRWCCAGRGTTAATAVIARLSAARGWRVAARALGDPARLPPDAAAAFAAWRAAGGETAPLHPEALRGAAPALLVDALFGGGLARPLPGLGAAGARLRAAGDAGGGPAERPRRRHGARPRGDLPPRPRRATSRRRTRGLRPRSPCRHRPRGVPQRPGAARLAPPTGGPAAQGAGVAQVRPRPCAGARRGRRGGAARRGWRRGRRCRVGAGLVTLGCPPAALIENAARLDAVMLRPVATPPRWRRCWPIGGSTPSARSGPGLAWTRARGRWRTGRPRRAGRAVVLDADALTAFAGDPGALAGLPREAVLTPMRASSAGCSRTSRAARRPSGGPAARRDALAAPRAGAVTVLLKGRDTVIAAPEGRAASPPAAYGTRAPWLATAGSRRRAGRA
jgi:ADP-dependent NAD(P)H-hydrate dehydratase / NAD(P)H-hydrate epimerase